MLALSTEGVQFSCDPLRWVLLAPHKYLMKLTGWVYAKGGDFFIVGALHQSISQLPAQGPRESEEEECERSSSVLEGMLGVRNHGFPRKEVLLCQANDLFC